MISVPIFRWSAISGGALCAPGLSLLKGPGGFPLHSHDFHEVFWVKSGRGVHTINGSEQPLHRGVMVWIRPNDCHSFRSDQRGVLVYNVAVAPALWARMRELFFSLDEHFWGGPVSDPPLTISLGADTVEVLCKGFEEFLSLPADDFHSLRFLLNIFHAAERAPSDEGSAGGDWQEALPDWLSGALRKFARDPGFLAGGTRALASLAGRSPEHVSRTLRQASGLTPREWVTRQRLYHAASQLRTTNRKVLDISLECGFDSLGHFYRVFTREYRVPPGDYRQQKRTGAI